MESQNRGRRPITIVPTHRPTPFTAGRATNGHSPSTTLDGEARDETPTIAQPQTARAQHQPRRRQGFVPRGDAAERA